MSAKNLFLPSFGKLRINIWKPGASEIDIEFGAELTLDEMNEISGGAFKKPAAKTGYTIYQIQAHDTLIRIANKFGIKSYKEILKWNPKITNPRLIRTGDYLYIKKYMTENMMDIGDIEFGAELTLDEMNEISGGAFKKPAAKTGYTIYQIQAHDTLIRIANKFGIKSYKEILKWNPKITNPRLIRTGDYLYIKK